MNMDITWGPDGPIIRNKIETPIRELGTIQSPQSPPTQDLIEECIRRSKSEGRTMFIFDSATRRSIPKGRFQTDAEKRVDKIVDIIRILMGFLNWLSSDRSVNLIQYLKYKGPSDQWPVSRFLSFAAFMSVILYILITIS